MICGKYVLTFAEASHAVPQAMHMNADYPFMLPTILRIEGDQITIRSGSNEATAHIQIKGGREYFTFAQSSTFEIMCRKPPQSFVFQPFKDVQSPAVSRADDLFKNAKDVRK